MPRRPDPTSKVQVACTACGAPLTRWRRYVAMADGRFFCDRACRSAWQKNAREAPRPCVVCGELFAPAYPLQRHCSYRCRGRAMQEHDPAVYFWPRVEKTETCWLWRGPLAKNGYGRVAYEGERTYTHRVSYILAHGPIADGAHVLHRCDGAYPPGDISYRACVRPDHLALGDQRQNTREAAERGRMAAGERSGTAKLTRKQVAAIRTIYAAGGVTQRHLGTVYGVNQRTISRVVLRKDWRHV